MLYEVITDLDHTRQIDGRTDHHHVYVSILDGGFQVTHLRVAVAHGGQDRASLGILLVGICNRLDRERARVHNLGSAEASYNFV